MARPALLITGVYGLLGQNLVRAFSSTHDVVGVDLPDPSPFAVPGLSRYAKLDITDKTAVARLLADWRPSLLINCAAVTNVDLCEKERDKADAVNHQALRHLLDAAPKARVVQMSTDYVFDGKAGPYADDAIPNPISWYGATKLRAEAALLSASPAHLAVRTMVLVGRARGLKPDFIHFVRSSLSEKKPIRIVTDQVGNITLASNLAANIRACLEAGMAGIVHLAGSDRLSRFDMALRIAERYGLDPSLITPIKTADLGQAAPRPLSSGFTHARARGVAGIRLLSLDELLEAYDHE